MCCHVTLAYFSILLAVRFRLGVSLTTEQHTADIAAIGFGFLDLKCSATVLESCEGSKIVKCASSINILDSLGAGDEKGGNNA